jgi:hypothetical protein
VQPQQDIIDFDSAQYILPSISIELTTSNGISLVPSSPDLPTSALTSADETEHLNPTLDMQVDLYISQNKYLIFYFAYLQ